LCRRTPRLRTCKYSLFILLYRFLSAPLTLSALSLFQKFEDSRLTKSISHNSFNTPAISPTTHPKLASSSARLLRVSSVSTGSETGVPASSRTICIWSLVLGTEQVLRFSSSYPLPSSVLVESQFPSPRGGVTTARGTWIFARLDRRYFRVHTSTLQIVTTTPLYPTMPFPYVTSSPSALDVNQELRVITHF
jgi:hypothetical protein